MTDLLLTSPAASASLAVLLGLLVGSFLNVVIHRLPIMLERDWARQAAEMRGETIPDQPTYNLMVPGSACPACGHRITALENIPVLSWLMLRGRCSACASPIPMRYPLVELVTALLSGLAVWHLGAGAAGIAALLLTWTLIALTGIDLDTQLLPDNLTLPLLWAGLAVNLAGVFVPLESAVIGAIAGYGSLWTVYWLFKLATGKEGMGYGDFKLLGALGAWFGWQALPGMILLSSLVGALVGIGLIVFARHGREVPIPFGPYLAGAGLLTLYFGKPIAAYLGLS
ncbi:MAG: A24 family peptidase [Betaproteobacteria bacterium]|nr:A24 family peptidase [Betaproteobacteria bacterium]